MSPEFAFPDWASSPDPSPLPPPPTVDAHRVGALVSGYIAAKQDALFDAPDAFYRQSGADAVAAATAVTQRLTGLRDATLEQAGDGERQALQTQLDAQLSDALDGIDSHVARHRNVRNREILSERQRLIERSATLEHNNDAKLAGLAEANAGAAQMLARMDGVPEEPAMQAARSAVWRTAISERIASGQGMEAQSLFHRVNDQLDPADRRALEVPIQAARADAAVDAWIARKQDKPGEPMAERVKADPDLSPAEKVTALARIEAQASAKESARIVTLQGLDDKLRATAHAIATRPGTYRPGTLAALAEAYEQAGEPIEAASIRRLAERESFLLSFARSSTEAQQRQIDSLPEGDERAGAQAIQDRQAEAFAKDSFAAGTALYPDVGPPRPIDDIEGRIAQARTIAAYRGIPVVPFTIAELAKLRRQYASGSPQEREAAIKLVDPLPDDVKPALEGPPASGPHTFSIGAAPSMEPVEELPGGGTEVSAPDTGARGAVHATEPPPGSPEFEEAVRKAREADTPEWGDLSFAQQLGVSFQRLNEDSKAPPSAPTRPPGACSKSRSSSSAKLPVAR